MTPETDVSPDSPDVEAIEEIFCDTCVLINYIQIEWERDRTSELLDETDLGIVIGETVNDELESVPERRVAIYEDFLDFVLQEEEGIEHYSPDVDVRLESNDYDHIEEMKMELISMDRTEARRLLRRVSRAVEVRATEVREDIVDEVVPRVTPFTLGFALDDVIPNDPDCNVVEEAVGWAIDGDSNVFVTMDSSDLIERAVDINEVIQENTEADVWLAIVKPTELLEPSPEA